MPKKKDMRFEKTEHALKSAFIDLLTTKGFDKISVKMIIDQAGINRSTFYAHYLDKFDLMDKIETELLDLLIVDLPEIDWHSDENLTTQFQKRSVGIVQKISEQRDMVVLLLSDKAGHSFEQHLQTRSRAMFSDVIADQELTIPKEYAMVLLTNTVASLLTTWVRNGFQESDADFTTILSKTMPSIASQLFIQNDN
ncbi:TetR/AcrR family transcriptional regulator [Fructobacillus sp. M1-13]|uniref:TetR family transcriptional regulator n=1 Tax=Fructobacillus papyriferae TaxID=2713171 RepID=A0ABS5QQ80_9LACO|nr:TetR/AcrR family transcriptional regulator [Fructobacillus papyriferae]MBS9335344.1 TetR family transcriptional regulator [Fructobacillus papyriferae]MCD2158987.1 TetR/AcrR family transcriptional regulator [Fructobacillus papyriferae]